jgi:hypothetical protein
LPPLPQHFSGIPDAADDRVAHRSHGRPARRTAAVGLAAAAALMIGGCGGSDSSTPSAGSPSSSIANPPLATVVTIGKVAGTVQKPNRQRFQHQAGHLRADVGKAVDAWFDGGFVGVDYPTTDFPDAFTTFTAQARVDAMKQPALMTTGRLGAHIDGVTTVKRSVALDVLAPRGKAAGVTARFVLRFRTSGDVTKQVTVSGRLFLTRSAGGAWRIFGYDVAKGSK